MADKKAKAVGTDEPVHDPFKPVPAPDIDPETGYEKGSRMDELVKELKKMGAR